VSKIVFEPFVLASLRRKTLARLWRLLTFSQDTMHYRDIIEFGANNVARFWVYITNAIEGTGDPTLPGLLNWNLDKGTIDPQGVGNATLWV